MLWCLVGPASGERSKAELLLVSLQEVNDWVLLPLIAFLAPQPPFAPQMLVLALVA